MRILIVEDDVQIADMLIEALTNRQYVVDVAQDGEEAWNYAQTLEYDLVLLDITLPKLNGIRLCQQLRDRHFSLPVLMLTARDTIEDKIIGLDAGADDYMVKPFDLRELMARIRALLRRGSSASTATLSWGSLYLNPSTYEVTFDERPLHLTPKEYALLELLVSSGRRVLSRPGIIERIWSLEDPPTEETVKSHVKTLRQKLREAGAPEDFIETVHGMGYRLKQLE
ncbi:response regulator transcription factor [Oscillatoria sp. FACHB-1407]|uniref:response regulator transcription factor n=1 Tax=Oscillatoria sp. FACHB-1407 TaxID=2692847 RepID=UPI001688B8AB|nr:response regulator transcription factor [Oscillatoria sp. FACHB-1407]MBD2465494.1 response regulator transcription factor [Oscillatoria sp. FACHB-1407]